LNGEVPSRAGGDSVRARDGRPVVSVIMPVYNGAQWLAAAVESVLAQTLSDLELLIVDDASTDDTVRIAEQFANRDPRVQLLRQARNRGQAAARNLAIERSRGVWIAPVDADDEIRPDRLRRLAEAGESQQADLIADGILFRGERPPGAPAELMTWRCDGPDLARLSAETMIRSGMAGGRCSLGYLKPLMRRRFLDERRLRYAEDLRFAEDFNLYVHALFHGARFLLYPESHYVYWQTPSSASRTEISRIARHALEGSQRLRASIPQAGSSALATALDEYEQRWRLLCWFEQMKRDVTNRHFRQLAESLFSPPASPARILRFVRDRARVRRQARAVEGWP
jgi:succinoglycan biosynthesis protein ExoO